MLSQSMMMSDDSRRETLSRYWRARPLSQQCPSGVLRVGTVESGIGEHRLLPYRNTLPLPIFKPAELGVRLGRGAPHSLEDLPSARAPDGVCTAKRDVLEITRDLPPVKPLCMEFAKASRTLGRSMSQEAQRGWRERWRKKGWWNEWMVLYNLCKSDEEMGTDVANVARQCKQ